MENEDLNELQNSSKFISGIYNYCDRWCEKCGFTNSCLSFEMSKNSFDNKAIVTDKKFWIDLENSFRTVKDMLSNYMKEHNIEPPSDKESALIESRMKKVDSLVKANPILLEAQHYNRFSNQLLNDNDFFKEEASQSKNNSTELYSKYEELLEIIIYYNNLIFVKISRALHSYYSKEYKEIEGYEEDKLVSARIAIVAIQRSMTAWHFFFENFKSSNDSIIDILLQLNSIKNKLEHIIPGVIQFRRPYFD